VICQSCWKMYHCITLRIWYMHNGAPAHFSRDVRDVLSNSCHGRRIDTWGPTAWPPRSPDLNPQDLYLWGHLRPLVYAAPVDNKEVLHRTVDACRTIPNYPGIFARMRRSMMRRVEACIDSHGEYCEHLLQTHSFNSNSRFRTHVDMGIFSCFCMWNSYPKYVRTFQLHPVCKVCVRIYIYIYILEME
jgi:hypothetical protein